MKKELIDELFLKSENFWSYSIITATDHFPATGKMISPVRFKQLNQVAE
jgi:hypothetical protein